MKEILILTLAIFVASCSSSSNTEDEQFTPYPNDPNSSMTQKKQK
jgi:hypothetical protein